MNYEQYLENKVQKLHKQADSAKTDIFKGCNIYITGHTKPPLQELRRLISSNGGLHAQFFTGTTTVTHVIAQSLTARKREQLARFPVVKPDWIVDSIKEGRLLAWSKYRTIPLPANVQKLTDFDNSRIESCLHPNFIDGFYSRSRLHHLSTWKAELKSRFQTGLTSKKVDYNSRIVMHVDFDSFFVSVALQKQPNLADKPVCVSNGGDSADVASCNYVARSSGVKNGMWVKEAKKLCPDLIALPYSFKDYETASTALYQVLNNLNADAFYPISVDEAMLDITSIAPSESPSELLEFASEIRTLIRRASGIEASVGIGQNVLTAKIALRKAKPGGQAYLSRQDVQNELTDLPVEQLPGVGNSVASKLGQSVTTIADLRNIGELELQKRVGSKLGTKLWKYSQGIDDDWDWLHGGHEPKTVGVDISWGIRLNNHEELNRFMDMICSELTKRYRRTGCRVSNLTAKLQIRAPGAPIDPPKYLGAGECISSSKSKIFTRIEQLGLSAKSMIVTLLGSNPVTDVRGIGLSLSLVRNDDKSKLKTIEGKLEMKQKTTGKPFITLKLEDLTGWLQTPEPLHEDVAMIEEYLMTEHWTRAYKIIEWMKFKAESPCWIALVRIYEDLLDERVRKEEMGYIDIENKFGKRMWEDMGENEEKERKRFMSV